MSQRFTVEEVKKSDQDEVVELSKNIWEGRDYIPEVFDKWVEEGGFYCGKLDGKIIALDKYTWQYNDVIWLEGLRVHPDYRDKGYARRLVDELMDILEDLDYKAVRFLTTSTKWPVIKLAFDHGFEVMQEYDYLSMDKEVISDKEIQNIDYKIHREDDVDEVYRFILNSDEYDWNKGQYMKHWTTYDLSKELIDKEIEEGRCYSIRDDGISSLIFLFYHELKKNLSIPFISGKLIEVLPLFRYGLNLCLKEGYTNYSIKTASSRIITQAQQVDMTYGHSPSVLLFEKKR